MTDEAQAPVTAPELSAETKRELRARAHHLQPVVLVGHAGLQPPVLAAVSRALRDHELIKVRMHEPEDKHGTAQALADATGAALCGLIGHTVILYKPKPKQKSGKPHHARRAF